MFDYITARGLLLVECNDVYLLDKLMLSLFFNHGFLNFTTLFKGLRLISSTTICALELST
jgi:hypothetical protein